LAKAVDLSIDNKKKRAKARSYSFDYLYRLFDHLIILLVR